MFRHLLVPADGSRLSRKAIRAAIAFAKETGARVTAYYAVEKTPQRVFGDGYQFPDARMAGELRKSLRAAGARYVATVGRAARAAGVRFDPLVTEAASPHQGIIEAARKRECDVIFMASHGRRGLARLALGSVTGKVLAHCDVPVLVYR